jgi:hypothetical protein
VDPRRWGGSEDNAADGRAGRRWTLVAAVVVIVVVVAGGVWVVGFRGSGNNVNSTASKAISNTPSATAVGGGHRSSTSITGPGRRCRLASKVSTAIPTATAPVTEWINVDGFYFPTTTSAGPLYRDGAAWTCFAHTPSGALLTATSVSVSVELGDQRAFESYFPPGHWSRAQLDSIAPAGGQTADPGVQIVGYQFGPFTRAGGTFSVVESCTQSACQDPYYAVSFDAEWLNRQWYLTGDTFQDGTSTGLASLAGVTPWGYVSQ